MIKVQNNGGNVTCESSGTILDLAQEVIAIKQFIKKNPEVEQLATLIEMVSSIEEECISKAEHKETTTEDKIKDLLGKLMN